MGQRLKKLFQITRNLKTSKYVYDSVNSILSKTNLFFGQLTLPNTKYYVLITL